MESLKYEIVLRVGVDNPIDYCSFEIDGDASVVELENMIVHMLDWRFNRISGPDEKEV